ncbi:MAG TPA: C1 family peptidase [Saprospiraceae bacterium]|nr:C1 family peptidase [Saprospiraceae bacterium]
MKRTLLFFLLLALGSQLIAQPQTKSILGISDLDMIERLMPLVPEVSVFESSNVEEQNIKSYLMPVRRVEKNGSEESYLLASCLEYYVNLNKNYKVNLSPDYISLNLRNQGKKVDFKTAFQQMAETGTVSAAIMPYGSSQLTAAVYATQKFNILNYLIIYRDMTRERQKIFELKKALIRGNPVIVELLAEASLPSAIGKTEVRLSNKGQEVYALMVVGFNEERNAFEVMSPWGSQWGKAGYLWISYDDLSRQSTAAYVMVPNVQW